MRPAGLRTPLVVLAAGSLVLCISLGIRHAFGLFLQPMSVDMGWGREVFSLAIAVQNLVWGVSQPFAGRLADRYGSSRIVLAGAVLYVAGLAMMGQPGSGSALILSAGVIVGLGLSGTTYPVIYGAISRAVPPSQRSAAFGIAMSVGSFGQFVFLPLTHSLITGLGWAQSLWLLAGVGLLILPLALAFREPAGNVRPVAIPLRTALGEALSHRGFWLLSLGFFICGFHVVFIATHLPAYLADNGLSPAVGATVLGLIGLFNIAGSLLAGWWGGFLSKPLMLSGIYALRLVVIGAFFLVPMSEWTAYAFGALMGLLWLSTVPLTNGAVATIFGVRNFAMLGGVVFLFHQLGAFAGGWLGGYVYDVTGSYQTVWLITVGLAAVAALLNLPVREQALHRTAGERT
ncbi:MFS transporter [Thioalkalivibrio thiocyanodenitrificans]|uniref:MFS transporter n=1 Tax=Thioalkalivibrio thiocyanodenitrificans TaxID=243063 RepID=UPI0003703FD5|nr:MFS transporter [Thioalkalivibrio thiocyanodenitrificans]